MFPYLQLGLDLLNAREALTIESAELLTPKYGGGKRKKERNKKDNKTNQKKKKKKRN